MLPPHIVNLASIPVVTGLVGYWTNKLAIKMLFRPYEPKWYTLGWQGIVPKTRPKLAVKISEIVGQKLLAHDDFIYALEQGGISDSINKIISGKLENISHKDIKALLRLMNIEETILRNADYINKVINYAVKMFLDILLSKKADADQINAIIKNISDNIDMDGKMDEMLLNAVSNILSPHKKLKDILPSFILEKQSELAEYITVTVLAYIRKKVREDSIKITLAQKVISFKNKKLQDGSGMDFVIGMAVNMFLSDEKIMQTVKDELPFIIDDLASNQDIYDNIYQTIYLEIDKFLNKNIGEISEKIDTDLPSAILKFIKKSVLQSGSVSDMVRSMIEQIFNVNDNFTWKELVSKFGIDIKKHININIADIVQSDIYELQKNRLINAATIYIRKNYLKISSSVTALTIKLIKNNLKYALKTINIEKIVRDKINALPLPEVENILFAFMKDHFKWINILGFVLGFLIGSIQALLTYFSEYI